ncbi:MAG: glycosyltransferase family 2 protein [Patescibacteria group bacterium]
MNKLPQNKIAIVLPAYNEKLLLDDLLSEIKFFFKNQVHIIVVDDGSADMTFEIASKYTDFVLKHLVNLGKGSALRTGCKFAFYTLGVDYVILMDADRQHAVSDLVKFIGKINKGQNLILGVRSFEGMPMLVALANKLTSSILKVIYGIYVPDILSGYKAMSKFVYESLSWRAVGYEVEIDIARTIAKEKMSFSTLRIKTIYPGYVKGVSFVDAVEVWFNFFGFR